MAKLVSKTYGDALFEVATESGQMDAYWEEVKAVRAALSENPELFKLMSHPKIVKEEKVKIIEDIFAGKVSGELVGLLRMIVEKGHFEEMDSVLEYFETQVKEYKNIGTAALIGGMVIRIGDRVVDSSVRTKISALTRELSKIQLKAGECAP